MIVGDVYRDLRQSEPCGRIRTGRSVTDENVTSGLELARNGYPLSGRLCAVSSRESNPAGQR